MKHLLNKKNVIHVNFNEITNNLRSVYVLLIDFTHFLNAIHQYLENRKVDSYALATLILLKTSAAGSWPTRIAVKS